MLAETGYRIGELLGVKYVKDIDYRNHMIRVCFREDNENEARAKNAEYRSAKVSNDTFEFHGLSGKISENPATSGLPVCEYHG